MKRLLTGWAVTVARAGVRVRVRVRVVIVRAVRARVVWSMECRSRVYRVLL
jgi:hypothetical protein